MIEAVFIFQPSGKCIFEKRFNGFKEDSGHIGAFVTALSLFSEETFGEKPNIIITTRYKMIISMDGTYNFVYIAANRITASYLKRLNAYVRPAFYRTLSPDIKKVLSENRIPDMPQFEQIIHKLVLE